MTAPHPLDLGEPVHYRHWWHGWMRVTVVGLARRYAGPSAGQPYEVRVDGDPTWGFWTTGARLHRFRPS